MFYRSIVVYVVALLPGLLFANRLAAQPTVEFLQPSHTFAENQGSGEFQVSILGPHNGFTLQLEDLGGTATPGEDYAPFPQGGIPVPAGTANLSLSLTLLDDSLFEALEFLQLRLVPDSAYTLGQQDSLSLRISDAERCNASFSRAADTLIETDGVHTFTLSLHRPHPTQSVQFLVFTEDNTAVGGQDFEPLYEFVSFPPGNTTLTRSLAIYDNAVSQTLQTFSLRVEPASAAAGIQFPYRQVVYLTDDDYRLPVNFELDKLRFFEAARVLQIPVRLFQPAETAGWVHLATTPLNATEGEDYTLLSDTLNFAAGQQFAFAEVELQNDQLNEALERFRLHIDTTSANFQVGASADLLVEISDNDPNSLPPERTAGELKAWPNPVTDQLFLQSSSAALLHLELWSLTGQRVLEKQLPLSGNEPAALPMTDLPAGTYLLLLREKGQPVRAIRLVKQ